MILATGLIEKLADHYPKAHLDMLVRKGNEGLLAGHPNLRQVLVWDKTKEKRKNLFRVRKQVQRNRYNIVINLQRFASTGMLTWLSGANQKIGFQKNPFAFAFTKKVSHRIGDGIHEIARNHQLIAHLTDEKPAKPKLYPSKEDERAIQQHTEKPFVTCAPASVWFTKQLPKEKWIELLKGVSENLTVFLLGGPSDYALNEEIKKAVGRSQLQNLAGQLTLLQSAALMAKARMNYVNDSAPLHLASAMNAPVTAFFCSTLPSFGFGPLSDQSTIVEISDDLYCRPCGLHGKKKCPEGHFKCGRNIALPKLTG